MLLNYDVCQMVNNDLDLISEKSLKQATDLTKKVFGPNHKMNSADIIHFFNRVKVCSIATVKKSGAPHVVPSSFIYLNGKIYLNTNKASLRYKNHKNSKLVAITILDGFNTVIIEGKNKILGNTKTFINTEIMMKFIDKYNRKRKIQDSVIVEINIDKLFSYKIKKAV